MGSFGLDTVHVDGDTRIIDCSYSSYNGGGITIKFNLNSNPTPAYAHEFGHYLIGGNEVHFYAGMSGLMSAYGNTLRSYAMNSWEKSKLNWVNLRTFSSTTDDITINDYLSCYDAVKIPISGTNQYFLIENHQRKNIWDNPDQDPSAPTGLYVLYYDGFHAAKLICADGKWDWDIVSTVPNPYGGSGVLPVFKKVAPNRLNGIADNERIYRSYNGTNYNEYIHFYYDPITNQVIEKAVFRGDGKDQFDLTNNNVFSFWSNPSACNGTVDSNVGFEVKSKEPNGSYGESYKIKIYVNNVQDAPPSRPQNLQSAYNASNNVELSWCGNSEPDMASYRIYRAVSSGGEPESYELAATIPYPATTWTDNQLTLGDDSWKVFYRVSAVDSDGKESLQSDYSWVNLISTNITYDATLSGNIVTYQDITVDSYLTISPGSTVTFKNGSSLIINGSLYASGTPSEMITFDFENIDYSTYNGIQLRGSAGISYATIKNAYRGLSTINLEAMIGLENITFESCYFGVQNWFETFTSLYNCTFNYNGYGVGTYSTNGAEYIQNIQNCYFNGNDVGIYCSSSSPRINSNQFISNMTGLYCILNAGPVFGNYLEAGNNYFYSNLDGILAYNGSYPILGTVSCQNIGAYNTFLRSLEYQIYADASSVVEAKNNYWDRLNIYGSGVHYDPYTIVSEYSPSSRISQSPEETVYNEEIANTAAASGPSSSGAQNAALSQNNGQLSEEIKYNPDWQLMRKVSFLRNLVLLGKNEKAQQTGKAIIQENPDSSLSLYALNLLWQASRTDKGRLDIFKTFLRELSSNSDKKELYGQAEIILALYEKENRIDALEKIRNKYKGDRIEQEVLLHKLHCFMDKPENRVKALDALKEIDQLFPNSEASKQGHSLLGNTKGKNRSLLSKKSSIEDNEPMNKTEEAGIPKEYRIIGNYPNPFNPETVIKYALPYESTVEITIYNTMGRLIRTYTLSSQSAGYKNIIWNGRDEMGTMASSGIYIYRLRAVSAEGKAFDKSAKMMLMK